MKEQFKPELVDLTEIQIGKETLLKNIYKFLDKKYKEKNTLKEENLKITIYKKTNYLTNNHRIYAIIEAHEFDKEVQRITEELLEEVNSYLNKRFSMNNRLTIFLILDKHNEKAEDFLYKPLNVPFKGKFKNMDPNKKYNLPVMKMIYFQKMSEIRIGVCDDTDFIPNDYILEYTRCKLLIEKITNK